MSDDRFTLYPGTPFELPGELFRVDSDWYFGPDDGNPVRGIDPPLRYLVDPEKVPGGLPKDLTFDKDDKACAIRNRMLNRFLDLNTPTRPHRTGRFPWHPSRDEIMTTLRTLTNHAKRAFKGREFTCFNLGMITEVPLGELDEVRIQFPKVPVAYGIEVSHGFFYIQSHEHANTYVFDQLGFTTEQILAFATKVYGYPPTNPENVGRAGITAAFPEFKRGDAGAAIRMAYALMRLRIRAEVREAADLVPEPEPNQPAPEPDNPFLSLYQAVKGR